MAVVAIVGGSTVYVTRRVIARELLTGWLDSRGVPSEVEFRDFSFGAFSARLRIGDARTPDVTADLVEVRYRFKGFWSGEPLGVQVLSVTLHRPIVRASFKGGKFSLGSLDPLIEEFAKRPPEPEGPQPRIDVRKGLVRLATDYGPLAARADGRMERGKLMALDAVFDPAQLKSPDFAVSTGEARLRLVTTGNRVDVLLTVPESSGAFGELRARGASLRLSAQGPYPDFKKQRGDGKVMARLTLEASELGQAADRLENVGLNARFEGTSAGWYETLALRGDGDVAAHVGKGTVAGLDLRGLKGDASIGDLRWTRSAGDVISSEISARASADSARSGDLTLTGAKADVGGLMAFDKRRMDLFLRGSVASRGAWSGLGPVTAADSAQTAALKKAAAGFQLTANSVSVNAANGDLAISLGVPARLRTDTGGEIALYRAGGPIFANGAGAFDLTVAGGGLPDAKLSASRYRLVEGGVIATAALTAKGGFDPVQDGAVDAAGEVRFVNGALDFAASRCAVVTAAKVELGENDVEKLDAQFCPSTAPLFSLKNGAWRLRGQAKAASGVMPSFEVKASEISGPIDLYGSGARLTGQVGILTARIDDQAAETRFRPIRGSGQLRAANGGWTGAFKASDLAGRHLADAQLRQGADGRGEVTFDTGQLAFAPDGLQPMNLSPLAAVVASPATGVARFQGQMAWSPDGLTSGGVLDVERLDFVSPMGPVAGLSGRAEFTSLVPLIAAPGQNLKAQSVATLVPLTDVDVRFGLEGDGLVVEGAQLAVGGGSLVFEPFKVPFAPGAAWSGTVQVNGVQVSDLIEASPFGDRVDLKAKLTGRLPFEVVPEGVRIHGGKLGAVEPGRLSILREALAQESASTPQATVSGAVTGVEAPLAKALAPQAGEVNPFSEFGYQALEHLAFDTLDAQVDSMTNGRLGVLLHIKGEHEPPKKQEIRLTVLQLIRRDFMNKALPLPSGTKVDLTLDTTLNLDQLLKDFVDFQALRGSQAVQP